MVIDGTEKEEGGIAREEEVSARGIRGVDDKEDGTEDGRDLMMSFWRIPTVSFSSFDF